LFAVGLHTCTAVARSLCVSWAFLFLNISLALRLSTVASPALPKCTKVRTLRESGPEDRAVPRPYVARRHIRTCRVDPKTALLSVFRHARHTYVHRYRTNRIGTSTNAAWIWPRHRVVRLVPAFTYRYNNSYLSSLAAAQQTNAQPGRYRTL